MENSEAKLTDVPDADGNGCTIFTNSPASAQVFQRSVNVGQVGVNVPILGELLFSGPQESKYSQCLLFSSVRPYTADGK